MIIILTNGIDPRLINVWSLTTDADTLIFPLSMLLSDLITEVYCYKYTQCTIWCGFIFQLPDCLIVHFLFYCQNQN
ncbi:VUT family protein [Legionella parisiensis]|uniref:VUT family protein n=1 Tax=Legionella parisiensis TaxID=45071 RepID=UPI0023565213|nr:VUT family protein [Legionella parisiensis]